MYLKNGPDNVTCPPDKPSTPRPHRLTLQWQRLCKLIPAAPVPDSEPAPALQGLTVSGDLSKHCARSCSSFCLESTEPPFLPNRCDLQAQMKSRCPPMPFRAPRASLPPASPSRPAPGHSGHVLCLPDFVGHFPLGTRPLRTGTPIVFMIVRLAAARNGH